MVLAKEGRRIVLPVLIIAIIFSTSVILIPILIMKIIAIISVIGFLFVFWFFRDPERNTNFDDKLVISPADGRVVAWDSFTDKYVGKAKMVSIFMNVFDVHVNRMPYDGKIIETIYTKGKFLAAYKPSASFENENRLIFIEKNDKKFTVRQIAGLLTRRIVPYLGKGDVAKKGDRFGLIMFGSRVDIVMPGDVELKVTLNQKLKAGETVIGEFK